MAYGLSVKNASGWYQISDTREGILAGGGVGGSGLITVKTALLQGPQGNYTSIAATENYPQVYIRPNYASYTALNTALGATSTFFLAIGAMYYYGTQMEVMVSNTSIDIAYLSYERANAYTPVAGTGYGLEVFDADGNVTYSSNAYAPIPKQILYVNTINPGQNSFTQTASDPPPWVLINNLKPIKVDVEEGLEEENFITYAGVMWNAASYTVGLQKLYSQTGVLSWPNIWPTENELIQAAVLLHGEI